MSGSGRVPRGVAVGLAVVAAVSGLSACQEIEEASPPVHEPAVVEPVAGRDVQRVTFDAKAAEQVSLRTATVRRSGAGTVVPYAALIYDDHGTAWVYTNPEPLTYLRAPVAVDRIRGSRVWLDDGPVPGTRVVTVGSTEVYGAELDIAGGH